MERFESFHPKKLTPPPETLKLSIEDFDDNPTLHNLLLRIPDELRPRHIVAIEDLTDDAAISYLQDFVEKRENARRESHISDEKCQEWFEGHEKEIWHALETHVFSDPENALGRGQTARVKQFTLGDERINAPIESMAVKYLTDPTEYTQSVSGEHDLLLEVERVEQIERIQTTHSEHIDRIRVPHPYFYYTHGKIQCYGMEEIDGINLERATNEAYAHELQEDLQKALATIDRTDLLKQIDEFLDLIHSVCLHGDIKPGNIMVSREGKFYIIDFGESTPVTKVEEKFEELVEMLKQGEKKKAREAINNFLNKLYEQ